MSNDLQARLARLSPEKRELLVKKIKEQSGPTGAAPDKPAAVMPRAAHAGALPLSYAQQRLWFLDQLEPGNAAYNMAIAYRLKGTLDVAALEHSLACIVQRHEILRTTFGWQDDQPVQIIHPEMGLDFHQVLVEAPEINREAEVHRLIAQVTNRPFDLEHGPLFRSILLQLDPTEHLLLLNMHHIIADEWSIGVMSRELTLCYQAALEGRSTALPDLAIQYADYAVWQRTWLHGEQFSTSLRYWKQQLADLPPVLELPTDHPLPPVQSARGAHHWFALSPALADQVRAFSQHEGATLFMSLLAAFQAVLQRYTGQCDLVIGSPIANRTRTELEPLIGFFVNTLVLRTPVSGQLTFRELVQRVRETTLNAYTHQDLPFDKLVEELQPDRTLSHTPLFQVMFAWQSEMTAAPVWPGVQIEAVELENETAKFDLTLTLANAGSHFSGRIEYRTELFEAETIARLAGHFETLLTAAVAQPDRPIADLPLLTPAEQHLLLVEWNANQAPYPRERCLHEWFEAQAQRTPDATALLYDDQHCTYRELNARASQLARYLHHLGVGPEMLVGICLPRTPDMIIGLLAILKAGGAYVPLDPNYPPERLAFMLQDSAAAILLTQTELLERLPHSQINVICLDTPEVVWPSVVSHSADRAVTSENLAYIIYTSGSTGRPKGVAITHRSGAALLAWAQTQYPAAVLQGVLAATSICFDLSIFEIFLPLSCGGTVILAETALHLPTLLAAPAVTLINTVPSALKELLHLKAVPDAVRVVNLAGEALSTQLVQHLYEQCPVEKVYDLYGPSEDTTYSTCALRHPAERATIGRPIANTQVYLLDAALNPVARGVAGEVYIGGAGLARGYLHRPELTAQRFVPHPFSAEPGARLYRTGDRARYLPDGRLEFLGRLDHQVKVRGYRIELGEIEAALTSIAVLQDCVVVVREDQAGDQQLVAYVVPKPDHDLSISALRDQLAARLPDYMLPTSIVMLPALPLNSNGKIDRRALPAPDHITVEKFVAPRTALEQRLADLWAEVLGLERVGITANFFELGGHSLLAARLVARLRQTMNMTISVRQLFEAPTIEALAAHLSDCTAPATPAPMPSAPDDEVERQGWPVPGDAARTVDVEPCTPAEKILAGLWCQFLGLKSVGVYDNFIELGGHSLVATQIAAQLRQRYGCAVAVSTLFEFPTIYALAAHLEDCLQPANLKPAITPRAAVHDQTAPLSFSQQQLWLVEQLAPGNSAYNIPLALRLTGTLEAAALHNSLAEIVRRHAALRTTVAVIDGQPVQVIAPSLDLQIVTFDLSETPVEQRVAAAHSLARDQARRPFDLAHEPLIRVERLMLGEKDNLLLIVIHHIVFDGWSIGIFLAELERLYRSFGTGQPASLPEVKRQYADFARWQRDALRGEELRRQLSFWKQQLSGAPALLDLPTDRPRPPVQSFRGAHHPIALSASLRQALRTVSQREGVTSFMLLLAAFKVLLLRCTGQTDIVVGAPVANREWPEFENTVGYFVNILVLRTRLTHDFTFRELLAQVRQTTLNAQVYQGTPFALLVEAQQPARNLSYNPIFQVMFSAGPVPVPPQLPGLEVSFVEIDTGIYQSADLRLDIEEGPQGLGGTVEYNTDLFETTTIIRLLEDYQTILTNIVTLDAACDQPLAALLPAPQITARPTTTDATSIPNHQVAQRKAAAAQRRAKLSSAQQALLEKRLGSN